MSSINEGSSGSLVIAQGQQELNINSSDEKTKNDDDLFELSRDQPSLSFQIEEEKKLNKIKQLCRRSKDDTLELKIIDQPKQENKRKRKEIFDRFKKKENTTINKTEEENGPENLLNIFDSIFSKKGLDPAAICGVYDASSRFDQNKPILQGISMRSRTPSAQKKARQKIFEKKNNPSLYGSVLPSNILEEQIEQKQIRVSPKDSPTSQKHMPLSYVSPVRADRSDDEIDFESLQKKISLIQPLQDDQRDSFEINNILESAIFRDENNQPRRLEPGMERLIDKPVQDKEADMRNLPTNIPEPNDEQIFKKRQSLVQPVLAGRTSGVSEVGSLKGQSNRSSVSLYQAGSNSPMQETKYLINHNNDLSSISSNPSVMIQDYQSRKLQLNVSNSMANIPHRHYEQMTTPRVQQINLKPSYLESSESQNLVESKVIHPSQRINISHLFEEETRLPMFLRTVRKHISVYPNFYIMKNSPNTPQTISDEFYLLLEEVSKAIKFLESMSQTVAQKKHKKQIYMSKIMGNLSVESFVRDNWHEIMQFDDYELIKPAEPIEVRVWNYDKAKTALTNYENVVKHYAAKGLKLDYSTDKGRKKYFDIRQKFWDICGNMKLISQDIFCEMRTCTFPPHYQKFRQFLASPFPGRLTQTRLDHIRKLTTLFRYLKGQNDTLVNSSIGTKINQKLQLQTYYLLPY